MNFNMIKFDFLNNEIKNPIIIVYMFVFPIIFFILISNVMVSFFENLQLSQNFYFIRIMLFIQFSLGTMISNALMENRVKYSNLRLAYVLSKPFDIVLSKLLSLIFFNILAIIFYIMVCNLVFNVDMQISFFKLTIIYFICGFFSMNVGLILVLILKDESLTNNIFGIIQLLVCIAGGLFYPVCFFNGIFIKISNFSLAKIILQAILEDNINNDLYIYGSLFFGGVSLLFISKKIFNVEHLMI